MRIWLIGAGRIGATTLRQLQKNQELEIIVSDPDPTPVAVEEGLIEASDLTENVTPFNVNDLARRIRPDLILLSPGGQEPRFSSMEGGRAFADALNYEITVASEFPCVILSLSNHR